MLRVKQQHQRMQAVDTSRLATAPTRPEPTQAAGDGFMNIPDAIEEELPFKC